MLLQKLKGKNDRRGNVKVAENKEMGTGVVVEICGSSFFSDSAYFRGVVCLWEIQDGQNYLGLMVDIKLGRLPPQFNIAQLNVSFLQTAQFT